MAQFSFPQYDISISSQAVHQTESMPEPSKNTLSSSVITTWEVTKSAKEKFV
jgi:hypothetical protein